MNVFRKVSPKRARKLRKRGESVKWIDRENSYVWVMRFKYANRWKYDTTRFEI